MASEFSTMAAKTMPVILVVDDQEANLRVVGQLLINAGYDIVPAMNGEQALERVRSASPDLILLDLMMPDVSGFDVIEALQLDAETARIPILVVTAKQISAIDRAALNCNPENIIHIVEKSGFNRGTFLAKVRRALQPH